MDCHGTKLALESFVNPTCNNSLPLRSRKYTAAICRMRNATDVCNILLSPKSPHLSNRPPLPCSSMEWPLFRCMTCRHAVVGPKTLTFLLMLVGDSSTRFARETYWICVSVAHFRPAAPRAAHAIRPQSGARPPSGPSSRSPLWLMR